MLRSGYFSRGFVALWAALATVGCEPKAGDRCDPGEARCLDAKSQLICSEGRYISSPCSGPAGCAQVDESVKCDFSRNAEKTPCSRADEGAAACVDAGQLVSCRGGQYHITACRGPTGCQTTAGQAESDRSIATRGELCSGEVRACDKDGSKVLACKGGKLDTLYFCRGPNGCEVGQKIECDLTVAREGDPCDLKMEGAVACGVDSSKVLTCKDTKFVLKQQCPGSQRCDPDQGMRCEGS